MRQFCLLCLIIILASCDKDAIYLEQALKSAKNNRAELEKVLEHYSLNPADSLKLRAAKFLIINMPGHYSYEGEYIEDYNRKIDSLIHQPIEMRNVLSYLPEQYPSLASKLKIKPDITTITADYLIHNIDLSFKIWKESFWLRELYFDDFCEYLLPYRIGREPLNYWKDSLPDIFRAKIADGQIIYRRLRKIHMLYTNFYIFTP